MSPAAEVSELTIPSLAASTFRIDLRLRVPLRVTVSCSVLDWTRLNTATSPWLPVPPPLVTA